MIWLLLLTLALGAITYWSGFRATPHPAQHLSKSGFFVFIALFLFTGYFAFQEFSAIDELAQIIEPVPDITEITYLPSRSEISAMTTITASVIPPYKKDEIPESNYRLQPQPRYWMVSTSMPVNSVIDFYRRKASKNGWQLERAAQPWMTFTRANERLSIYILTNSFGEGSTILYTAVLDNH